MWIKDTVENRRKLRQVLADLDIGDFENIETTQFIPGYTSITLNSGFQLDLMTDLKGFEQAKFDDSFALAITATIENVPVKFLHINQLIEAKKAAGRPKDLVDIEELEKIRKLQDNK